MRPMRVVEQHVPYRGHIELHVDVLADEQRETHEYAYISTPGAVCAVTLLPGGEAVLVRQHRHPLGEALVELPAGGIDEGETPEQAIRRELEEECSLRPGSLVPLGHIVPSPGVSAEVIHLFLARDCREVEDAAEGEQVGLVRLPLAELLAQVTGGALADGKTVAGVLRAQARGLLAC
jgi:ADP-ribose pyrophosphatase